MTGYFTKIAYDGTMSQVEALMCQLVDFIKRKENLVVKRANFNFTPNPSLGFFIDVKT